MKKLLLFVVVLIFLASCEQDPFVNDYRNEFTGTYSCEKIGYSQVYMQPPNYDTSIVNVVVAKDASASDKIIIDGDTVVIDETGEVNETNYSAHTVYNLKFSNDSIYLYYGYFYLGGTGTTTIRGVKNN